MNRLPQSYQDPDGLDNRGGRSETISVVIFSQSLDVTYVAALECLVGITSLNDGDTALTLDWSIQWRILPLVEGICFIAVCPGVL